MFAGGRLTGEPVSALQENVTCFGPNLQGDLYTVPILFLVISLIFLILVGVHSALLPGDAVRIVLGGNLDDVRAEKQKVKMASGDFTQ